MLGLQEKHIGYATGWVWVEQRWYRGDLDVVKSEASDREVLVGNLLASLQIRQAPS